MKLKIDKIEYYLPKNIEDVSHLKFDNPEWKVEAIEDKIGINKRHIADVEETTTNMAYYAAKKIINSDLIRKETGFLIFITQSSEFPLPTSACVLQEKLSLSKSSMCFDINLGCSGYIYGLSIAGSLIESGFANSGLIICSEKYSQYISKNNQTCRPIFSDGAAATYVKKDINDFVGPFEMGTDGSGYNNLIVPRVEDFLVKNKNLTKDELYMSGADVFTFTMSMVPKSVNNLLNKSNKKIKDIDLFIFHQASKVVLEKLRKTLNIPADKIFNNYNEIGNTVSASIPIALKEAENRGKLIKDYDVMLVGFGVGYSWGSCIIKWT